MKLIIAVIKPDRLEAVKQELYKVEVNLITVNEVLGHGRQWASPKFTGASGKWGTCSGRCSFL